MSLAFPVHRPLEIRERSPHGRLPLTCVVPVQGSWTWEYVLEEQGRIQKRMCDWGKALLFFSSFIFFLGGGWCPLSYFHEEGLDWLFLGSTVCPELRKPPQIWRSGELRHAEPGHPSEPVGGP